MSQGLVGNQRNRIVDDLLGLYEVIREDAGPHLVVISAPVGWGKTRIVHEFYQRLTAEFQSNPPYWPPRIDGDLAPDSEPLSRRKRTHPVAFQIPPKATIDFMWWGLLCHKREDSRPAQVLSDDSTQLFQHSVAIEARNHSSLRAAISAGRLGEVSGLYQRGSLTLDLLAAFGVTFPPVAWTKLIADGALATYDTYTRWNSATRIKKSRQTDDVTIDVEDSQRSELVERVADATISLSIQEIPFVILVDDAHNHDESLLQFIHHILAEPSARVLVLLLSWPDQTSTEAKTRLSEWLVSLESDLYGTVSRVQLDALSVDDLAEIVYEAAPQTSPTVARSLAARFAPNPFSLRQALTFRTVKRSIIENAIALSEPEIASLPSDLIQQYRQKWEELPEQVKDALSVSSWQGQRFLGEASSRGAIAVALEDIAAGMLAAVEPYAWARTLDEWVQAFVEPDLHLLAQEWWGRSFTADDEATLKQAVGAYLAETVRWGPDWPGYSTLAKRCALEVLLRLDAEGAFAMENERTDMILELSENYVADLRYADALSLLSESIPLPGIDDPSRFQLLRRLAQVHTALGNVSEAVEAVESAAELVHVATPDGVFELQLERSEILADRGEYVLARELLADATIDSPTSPKLLVRASILEGRLHGELGEFDRAIESTANTVADAEELWGRSAPETVNALNNRAWFLSRAGQARAALVAATDASRRVVEVLPSNHRVALEALNNVARFSLRVGEVGKAIELGREVAAARQESLGEHHQKTLTSWDNLGLYLLHGGQADEALSILESVVQGWAGSLGEGHPKALSARRNLALARSRVGRDEEAIELARSAIGDHERVFGEEHPNTVRALIVGAEIARSADSSALYEEWKARAKAASARYPTGHPERVDAYKLH